MANNFTAVDLSQLPAPSVVEALDFEVLLAAILADYLARMAATGLPFTALVESDPAYKMAEVCAYRELLMRQRVNEAALATMLPYAVGADLDNIAARYDVQRLLIELGNADAIPPTPDVYEPDGDLRRRCLLALESYTTAGSVGSYVFHALSADGDVADAAVASPPITPGTVNVAVLSRTGTGAAPAGTITAVVNALSPDDVRPLCDTVVVNSAAIVNYAITATLDMYAGAGQAQVLATAIAAVTIWAANMRLLGLDITRSALTAQLHQAGVYRVNLTAPAADVVIDWNQCANCTAINVTQGAINE
jgi:phage-related baseplate assembly protein